MKKVKIVSQHKKVTNKDLIGARLLLHHKVYWRITTNGYWRSQIPKIQKKRFQKTQRERESLFPHPTVA
jgi:hypothetical protein